jgi:hypothetical protein
VVVLEEEGAGAEEEAACLEMAETSDPAMGAGAVGVEVASFFASEVGAAEDGDAGACEEEGAVAGLGAVGTEVDVGAADGASFSAKGPGEVGLDAMGAPGIVCSRATGAVV